MSSLQKSKGLEGGVKQGFNEGLEGLGQGLGFNEGSGLAMSP